MAFNAFVDAFNIGTGAVASTVVRTGYGFQPKACIYWWSGRTESAATFARASLQPGVGFATSSTSRANVTGMSQDTAGTMVTRRRQDNSTCIACITSAGALDGTADVQQFDSDGQTLVIDKQFTINLRVHCLALGGDELTNAAVVQFQSSTLGLVSVTSLSFQPTVLLLMTGGNTAAPPSSVGFSPQINLGMVTSASQQGVIAFRDTDNLGSSQTTHYSYGGECIALINSSAATYYRAAFDSFLSNGFRLNWLDWPGVSESNYFWGLALQGGQAVVGNFVTSTTLNATMAASGFGFVPTGVLLMSVAAPVSTQDTPTAQANLSLGAFTSPSNRACQAVVSNNGANAAVCASSTREDACLQMLNNGTTSAGVVDVSSIDSDGFTAIMDVADVTTTKYVTYLAFGSSGAPPVGGPLLPHMMHHAG